MTLVRFDEVYVVYFKTNFGRIVDFPNLLNHCREVYQLPGIASSIHMDHIKTHYFTVGAVWLVECVCVNE